MSDNKVINFSTEIHPLACYVGGFSDTAEAPEFVVDDVVTAGTVVVAGERGIGKTSALVPLMIAPTGLLSSYPLTASIRRKVVYIAEDAAQVRRIISAMRSAGMIATSKNEFNEWFRLVEAKRMPAHEIVKVVPFYDDLWTENKKVDGSIYLAPPVVVLDTTNATIDLDNISDNSEVSGAVATLRQRFGDICLLMVGHVSKASRSDARQLSFVGAGSWEGDTQQSLYLVSEDDQRYLVLGKKRFEATTTEYLLHSSVASFDAYDKLGRLVKIRCFYAIPDATSQEKKAEDKALRQAEVKAAAWAGMQSRVLEYISKHPKATTREVSESVTGKDLTVRKALDELVEKGEVRVEDGERNARHHFVPSGHSGTQSGGYGE